MKIVGKMCSIDYFVIPRYQAQKLSSRDIQGTGLVHCSSFSPAPVENVTRHSDTTSGLGMMVTISQHTCTSRDYKTHCTFITECIT